MYRPLVSVIIPVYNGEPYLSNAIDNILAQTYRPIEIVVVNDGSTDNSDAVARRYKKDIVYAVQENRGPGAARNKGLLLASGNIVAFLDVDDLWSENKLSVQLADLTSDASVEIVLGLTQVMRLRTSQEDKLNFEKWGDPICVLSLAAGVFRRSVFDKVGFFDETLYYGEDVDWFMRARETGVKITILQEVGLFYRLHASNMTLDAVQRDKYLVRAYKKSLDRRRGSGDGMIAPLAKVVYPESVSRTLRALKKRLEKASDAEANGIDTDR
jgi:glycosyltransferase involved in cell wall biosynthesis